MCFSMANESFAEFADSLQKEIEDETGIKFGIIQIESFVGKTYEKEVEVEKIITDEQATQAVEMLKNAGVIDDSGKIDETINYEEIKSKIAELPQVPEALKAVVAQTIVQAAQTPKEVAQPITTETLSGTSYTETVIEETTISYDYAAALVSDLEDKKLINKKGEMSKTMKNQLAAGTLDLGDRYSQAEQRAILQIAQQSNAKLPIREDKKEVTVRLKKQAILSPEFMEIWNRIKQKTTYRVKVNFDVLLENCTKDFENMPPIPTARIVTQTAGIEQSQEVGVTYTEQGIRNIELDSNYDIILCP